ncbi:MAG: Synechococcus phage [Cyanobacteriota bacterium]
MIRIFKLLFLLVISQVAFAQAPSNYTNINGRYRWIAGMFDSTFHIPKGSTPSLRTGGSTNAGGLFYNTSDSSVYTYTGTQWIKVRGSLNPSDTTNKYVTQVYKKSGSDSVFYVKGGVHTWAFNDSTGAPGGGGGGKVYYFNGGVSMGTFGGFTMYELGDTANTGAAANFTRSTTGNIANFITDPGKPGLLQIPAGVWTIDAYLNETGGGSNSAEIYVAVEKWDGSTITTIATSPIEQITNGNVIDLYTWSVTIPTTALAVTDRIIIQFYIQNTNGKTVTLYTQNGYVGEVHTTFTTGIGAINGLTAPAQYLVTGTSGTDFNISSATATHTFNLPTASATNRGALSSTDWTTFNNKGSVSSVATNTGTGITGGTITTSGTLAIDTLLISTRAWRQKGIDSVASLVTSGYVPSSRTITINGTTQDLSANRTYNVGTVTSVATSSATGITGGTFTTSGTIAADTLLLSTRAWRQKGIDSVASLINTRVSGTTNYIPKFTSSSAIGNSTMLTDANGNIIVSSGQTWGTSAGGLNLSSVSDDGYVTTYYDNKNLTLGAGVTSKNRIVIEGQAGGNNINFNVFGSEQMRLTSTGLGIGVTNPGSYNSNAYKLVVGGLANSGITIVGDASEGSSNLYFADGTTGDQAYRGQIAYTHSNDYMFFATAASTRMTITNGGNVGIGTSSPSGAAGLALAINGGSSQTRIALKNSTTGDAAGDGFQILLDAGSADAAIENRENGNLRFATNGGERMRITSAGLVGIGTSSPNYRLDVKGGNASTLRLDNDGSQYTQLVFERNTTANSGADFLLDGTGATFGIRTLAAYPITFSTSSVAGSPTERMRITSGGDVQIGTTTVSFASANRRVLEINGTSNTLLGFKTGDAQKAYLYHDGTAFTFSNMANGSMVFGTNDTERMRITSGGVLAVGTTSVLPGGGGSGGIGFNVNTSGTIINQSSADYNAYFAKISGYSNSGFLAFYVTGNLRGNITTDGSSVYYNNLSDYRLKQDLKEFNGLNLISKIPVYDFQWKENNKRSYGVMAHELQSVIPYVVTGEKDGKEMQVVDYSKLVPVLIKAIQELKAEIETIKNK